MHNFKQNSPSGFHFMGMVSKTGIKKSFFRNKKTPNFMFYPFATEYRLKQMIALDKLTKHFT